MRVHWLILSVFLLAGCGQPLQIRQPSAQAATAPAPQATDSLAGTATSAAPLPGGELPTGAPSGTPAIETAPTSVTLSPTTPSIIVVPRTAVPLDNLQRWRAQELNREAFAEPRTYRANQPVPLFWFDPANEQIVEVGSVVGDFSAQAQFTLKSTNQPALEVLYRVNTDFGLTAISESLRDRMRKAYSGEQVEAYVLVSEAVTIQQ